MAKNMQNENYKRRNTKQRSKQNSYTECNSNEKFNNRTTENTFKFGNQSSQKYTKKGTIPTECSQTADKYNDYPNESNKTNGDFKKNNCIVETKIKNSFTIKSYKRKQDGRRKNNDFINNIDFQTPSDHNNNRFETKNNRYVPKSSTLTTLPNSDHYLKAGTYEGEELLMKDSKEKIFSDDDNYSVISDISDFCQRQQFNVDCYNYYLNFGDPYVMNNGEISTSENNWYYDRPPNFSRVFYYRNQFNDLCYESAMTYNNYPNHQEFKYRNIEPYSFCNSRELFANNYISNGYVNGYLDSGMVQNEYYPYPIPHSQDLIQERYCKPTTLEETDEMLNSNHYTQENDAMNVINLNSSLFVYNSNVHINTVHNEIYGTNMEANTESTNNDETNLNNNTVVQDSTIINSIKDLTSEKDQPSSECENSN